MSVRKGAQGFFSQHPRIQSVALLVFAIAFASSDASRIADANRTLDHRAWLSGLLIGVAAGATLLLIAGALVPAIRRQGPLSTTIELVVGLVLLALFVITHPRFGRQDLVDSGPQLALLLAADVVFVGGLICGAVYRWSQSYGWVD